MQWVGDERPCRALEVPVCGLCHRASKLDHSTHRESSLSEIWAKAVRQILHRVGASGGVLANLVIDFIESMEAFALGLAENPEGAFSPGLPCQPISCGTTQSA